MVVPSLERSLIIYITGWKKAMSTRFVCRTLYFSFLPLRFWTLIDKYFLSIAKEPLKGLKS